MILMSCIPENRPIPAGIYIPELGEERVSITASTVIFHVIADKEMPARYVDREFDYSVNQDGLIQFEMTSNDFFLRLGWYNWYWRDDKIARVDLTTKQTIWFIRSEE